MDSKPSRIPCFCKNEITWWDVLTHALERGCEDISEAIENRVVKGESNLQVAIHF